MSTPTGPELPEGTGETLATVIAEAIGSHQGLRTTGGPFDQVTRCGGCPHEYENWGTQDEVNAHLAEVIAETVTAFQDRQQVIPEPAVVPDPDGYPSWEPGSGMKTGGLDLDELERQLDPRVITFGLGTIKALVTELRETREELRYAKVVEFPDKWHEGFDHAGESNTLLRGPWYGRSDNPYLRPGERR